MAVVYGQFDGKTQVCVVKKEANADETMLASEDVAATRITLCISQKGQTATLSYDAGDGEKVIVSNLSTKFLSTESAGGFVGCTIGMYATANGDESSNTAYFGGIDYKAE